MSTATYSTTTAQTSPHQPQPVALPHLIAAAVQGDQQAWNNLVRRYSPLVSSVIRGYSMSASDADDVAQNVWMRLVEHLKDLREPLALPGWIVTITRNEARRLLTANRRSEPVDPQLDSRLDKVDDRELDLGLRHAENRRAIHAGLGELIPEHRELIELTFADTPIPYRLISGRLGIPVGSIGPTRARCLKKLQTSSAIRALAS